MYLTVSPVQIIDESLEKYGKTETSASEPQHLCQTAGFAAAAWMMLPAPVSVINMSSGGGHKNILTTNVRSFVIQICHKFSTFLMALRNACVPRFHLCHDKMHRCCCLWRNLVPVCPHLSAGGPFLVLARKFSRAFSNAAVKLKPQWPILFTSTLLSICLFMSILSLSLCSMSRSLSSL